MSPVQIVRNRMMRVTEIHHDLLLFTKHRAMVTTTYVAHTVCCMNKEGSFDPLRHKKKMKGKFLFVLLRSTVE